MVEATRPDARLRVPLLALAEVVEDDEWGALLWFRAADAAGGDLVSLGEALAVRIEGGDVVLAIETDEGSAEARVSAAVRAAAGSGCGDRSPPASGRPSGRAPAGPSPA